MNLIQNRKETIYERNTCISTGSYKLLYLYTFFNPEEYVGSEPLLDINLYQ